MILPNEAQSAADVGGHYDELDAVYRSIWGEHVHHGLWRTGRESPREATDALADLVAERLDLAPGQKLVDIGCGYGATAARLAGRHRVAVTGLTISAAQARIAGARTDVTCLLGDWLDNRLPGAAFDRAYAIESSEHMVDKARFFAEAFRVLKPGGRFVVCAWLAASAPSRFQVRHLLEPICREGRLPSMGSREDYEALARDAGFAAAGFEDISRQVRKTWSLVARRVAAGLVADPALRRLAFRRGTKNRAFLLSLPRLMLALRTGAMRYGVFVWNK
ncbi:MAG TPA: class I SAM-dependent methyltransferase [Allosphingosinicella sp.]|nr:class I SAM-dependent methyltransferase [Allosphingosinicella sp.]